MGSWVVYGLGSESESLPAYVVMPDPEGRAGGRPADVHARLPAGRLSADDVPPRRPAGAATSTCRRASIRGSGGETVELIRELNEATLDPDDEEFAARINAYDLAFRMQTEAPEVFDLSRETQETLDLYGVGAEPTRRLRPALPAGPAAGREGRAVRRASSPAAGRATCSGTPTSDIEENHLRMAAETDKPVAGLLTDLKRRGLLDSTLVLWGGEFGRSPEAQVGQGARPPQPRLHDVAGRRRHQGRPGRRRHRRHRPAGRREAATTSATSTPRSCTSSASTRTS